MDDLTELNRCIAKHWLGHLDASQEEYLGYTSVCLGQFSYSTAYLAEALRDARIARENALRVLELNRRYLKFARLAARDVVAGNPEMLIRLGITLELADWLGKLSDEDIGMLALTLQEPIVRFIASQAFCRGAAMQSAVAKHHATAMIVASAPQKTR